MSALRRFTKNGNTHINGRYCDANEAMELIKQQAAELDALKAHVERLREDLKSILGWRELRNTSAIPIERIEEVARMALDATPQATPAEHDAALKAHVERLRRTWQSSGGCSSHNCCIKTPNTVGTNGGCRCYENRAKMMGLTQRMNAVFQQSPHQSLAERDAELAKKAILSVLEIDHSYLQTEEGQFAFYDYGIESHAEQYANKIRNGKDGE